MSKNSFGREVFIIVVRTSMRSVEGIFEVFQLYEKKIIQAFIACLLLFNEFDI